MSDTTHTGPVLAADGTPLKRSLARALRMQKIRALMLIAPLLLFVLLTFILPIADMLFRSVENKIVSDTLPETVVAVQDWDADSGVTPPAPVFEALAYDLVVAAERKEHTRVGSRLNYENPGISSLFRKAGRRADDIGKVYIKQFEKLDPAWKEPATFVSIFADPAWVSSRSDDAEPLFEVSETAAAALPKASTAYTRWARTIQQEDNDSPTKEDPWAPVYLALHNDLAANPQAPSAFGGDAQAALQAVATAIAAGEVETTTAYDAFVKIDEDWTDPEVWRTLKTYSGAYTNGYFLNAADFQKGADGAELRPESERIYGTLFLRTLLMSLAITVSCIVLGYPVAWILANLPSRTANLLMILVLLPFWTSLLVRTSAWKVMLQQQGVINDTLVWLGLVADDARLVMINNQFGTIVAMTHILLPFMILPMYSVMQTINPSYLRAAKSLGATNWTAFWRVYFPQSVPGIGAGSILVFILAIGYYITPELVGGTKGVFISNRIAFHISQSLNWGLAAALGSILLVVVLALYWAYDKIVGIDNVKLG
ncbi:Spermidine/putrescine transport system permease protein PotB [Phaeobacter italicus]|jgi:putative spermidine/putrescine transport system permease protein|uniref:Spermidine/putrescine transport system permease protein PotB n=1 Tax=Phaeobacter italicus TaxID=481446 RepID=A0A0H5D6Q1_9RHOB|nr:ABC transporter permease [Phaeobacter italicus]CRL12766.1 Spermidine/putrescine transport system permease protein PotB [Phaeobacter italicus]